MHVRRAELDELRVDEVAERHGALARVSVAVGVVLRRQPLLRRRIGVGLGFVEIGCMGCMIVWDVCMLIRDEEEGVCGRN